MRAPAIFADVELWATTYLRGVLDDYGYGTVRVSNAYKGTTGVAEVVIRRDGGPRNGLVEAARIGVNVYGIKDGGEQAVANLARTVAALLCAAVDGDVSRVTQSSGPSPVPDSMPRRYMTFEAHLRPANL